MDVTLACVCKHSMSQWQSFSTLINEIIKLLAWASAALIVVQEVHKCATAILID